MGKLDNKLALVTGSSRGIGRQIAVGLARLGCNVILHGRTAENCAKTAALIEPYGVKIHAVGGELSSVASVENIISQVNAYNGAVDILYNNAAINRPLRSIWDFSKAEYDDLMMVNVYSMAMLCAAFSPGMRDRGYGRIINLTSGISDFPALVTYGVSKAAVDKYTKDLAFELKGTGVLANYLDPGWLKTDLGGPQAPGEVESVLPGALVPALLDDDGPTGQLYRAQELRDAKVF